MLRKQTFRELSDRWEAAGDVRVLIRFDLASANVVLREPSGAALPLFSCRLDVPLAADEVACAPPADYPRYTKRTETLLGVGTRALTITTGYTGVRLAASIGVFQEAVEGAGANLVYARVGGAVFETPIAGMHDVPDPTLPEAYYPLAVGNEWQYDDCVQEGSSSCNISHEYVRRTVERETVVAGTRYFVEVERRYTTASVPLGQSERLLRFDGATLVRRDGAAGVPVSCPLDADFDATVACGEFGAARVYPQNTGPLASAEKVYEIGSDSWEGYTAGVGLVGQQFWASPFTLRYARVGGEVVSAIVAGETDAALAAALGRRVWRVDVSLGAGAQTVAVDASAWAPGAYVVRATAGRASVAARIVRR